MNKNVFIAGTLILITTIFVDIIIQQTMGFVPAWVTPVKFIFLLAVYLLTLFVNKFRSYSGLTLILTTITCVIILTNFIQTTVFWKSAFNTATFIGNFSSSIILKFIGILPVVGVLFLLFQSRKDFYLCKGDLNQKANKISWLGIKENTISWGKLALISALLISFGTILLTMLTVTNFSSIKGLSGFLKYLPIIIMLAVANSFCEGVVFRSAILGTLKEFLPKNASILLAASFFGIGHFYGAPSGIIGVAMSGLLGWYMCRSMYETKGFVSSWLIHLMQDTVIFSTIYLVGNFS